MSDADRNKWDERYRSGAYADRTHSSALLQRWIGRIPRGRALDVACGAGRNALFLASHGFDVDAVDISREALRRAKDAARERNLDINWIEHDLDEPLTVRSDYALILVVRFLDLPLIGRLARLLGPGGYLVCEQHLRTDADVIGPANPAYRVEPGELPKVAGGLEFAWFEEGFVDDPDGGRAALARLVARRP
jgi:tellurite methyltransferase